MQVLLVGNDTTRRDRTARLLRAAGISTVRSSTVPSALANHAGWRTDVVLLELGDPPEACLDLLRRIRAIDPVPVVVLTDLRHSAASDFAFELGADAHITTPVGPRELGVRIHAVRRRAEWTHLARPERALLVGDLRLEPTTGEATIMGKTVHLTPRESRIVHLLALNSGKIVPLGRLLRFVWNPEEGDINSLRAHLSHVRAKLAGAGIRITAEPGVGYRLDDVSTGRANQEPVAIAPRREGRG